jgi:hypothetical protein
VEGIGFSKTQIPISRRRLCMTEENVSNSFSNIGLIKVFVRRANIRFAPTLVLSF